MHQHAVGDGHELHLQLRHQRALQALVVGHGVVQRGRVHGDHGADEVVGKADAGFADALLGVVEDAHLLAGAQIGGLHAGFVGRGDVGNLHDHVGDDAAVAGQPPTGGVVLLGDVAGAGGIQLALHEAHLALAAGAVAGAGRVDGDVGLARDLEQVFILSGEDLTVLALFKTEAYLIHAYTPLLLYLCLYLTTNPWNWQGRFSPD